MNATLEAPTRQPLSPALSPAYGGVGAGSVEPAEIVRNITRYECPRCEYAIPRECVMLHLPNPHELATGDRRLSVYCPACREAYQSVVSYMSGQIRQISPARKIEDVALLDTLKSGIEGVQAFSGLRDGATPAERKAARQRAEQQQAEAEEFRTPPLPPATPLMRALELDEAIQRTEAELMNLRIQQRSALRLMASERRVPPTGNDDCEICHGFGRISPEDVLCGHCGGSGRTPIAVAAMDTDCDLAAARVLDRAVQTRIGDPDFDQRETYTENSLTEHDSNGDA